MSSSPAPSALATLLRKTHSSSGEADQLWNLARTIAYNLEHEHYWSSVKIHLKSPLDSQSPLPRPLISGVPKSSVYVHPDVQIERLTSGGQAGEVEREWVLPSHLKERWSLRRFAECFDSIGQEPPVGDDDPDAAFKSSLKPRRGGKRMLLATLEDDSTVVYYVVHDGLVKPRQN